ncbi:carbohydrate-selective porin OprB [Leptolyngbya sp. NIES-3755]|nr:carbohydrate-selective porin OprB [Leptolyngbya sp. NIES-3755]
MKKRSLLLIVGASLTVSFSAIAKEANPEAVPSTIRSTDWQFQVLKSIDRQCFPGNLAFAERNNQSVSRYEFAAVVNACRERMEKLLPKLVRREDIKNLRILEREFAAELIVLRDRNAEVERRSAELERQQFSTETKSQPTVFVTLPYEQFSTETKSGVTVAFEVLPDDSRHQALISLIQRYGCLVGSEFSANQALTRMQFATALNACVDRANELIAAATSDLVKKEDLEMLQKLEREFALELHILRDLVTQVGIPERPQFSTTGVLRSQVILAVTPDMKVKSTDWEFGELRSLSQRYNCSIDFLSKNQPVTRIEFAAKLSDCLNHINELTAQSTDTVQKADIVRFQKLAEVFSAELLSRDKPDLQPSRSY